MISTKLQGRLRLSSCSARMPSQPSFTAPSNGGPACQYHNRWKTRGYTTRRNPNGTWHTYRPDGTELTQPRAA